MRWIGIIEVNVRVVPSRLNLNEMYYYITKDRIVKKYVYGDKTDQDISSLQITLNHDYGIGIFIYSVSTDKDYYNQGYATDLIKFILQNYPNNNFYLTVYTDNVIAIHLYKKLGFKIQENCGYYLVMKYE